MSSKYGKDLYQVVERSLEDSKAQNTVTIDLFNRSSLCDQIIITTGTSSKHVHSIVMNLKKDLKKYGIKHPNAEGTEHSNWVILDTGDIIIHVFQSDVRNHYRLEELWQSDHKKV